MSSEQIATAAVAGAPGTDAGAETRSAVDRAGSCSSAAVIVLDIVALILVPAVPQGRAARATPCAFPVCFIEGTLEFPAPHTVVDLAPDAAPPPTDLVTFYPSISSTILTMWIVMALVLVGADPDDPRREAHPGPAPRTSSSAFYEFLQRLRRRASPGRPRARTSRSSSAFFLLILF